VAHVPAVQAPLSVLVVIHTPDLDVLLINRADTPGHWQSVTGSKDSVDESFEETAIREVKEETASPARTGGSPTGGWRTSTTSIPTTCTATPPASCATRARVRAVRAGRQPVTLNPREHTAYQWLTWRKAADTCFSPSNAEAILMLPEFRQ
jgi:dATP pyrophosphohydrolase